MKKCNICHEASNCINGRYCNKLHCYVEHDKEPRCLTNK
jgi:hypothetical protein